MSVFQTPPLFKARMSAVFTLQPRNRSGGVSLDNSEQIIGGPHARWSARLTLVARSEAEKASWRGFLAELDGRANAFWLGPWCCIPLPVAARFSYVEDTQIPHSDGTLHADDTGYANSPPEFTLASGIGPFASLITVNQLGWPAGWRVGDYFMLDGRLRIVTGVMNTSAGSSTLRFRPPVARTLPAGSRVILGGQAAMKLTDELGGALSNDLGRSATVGLDLLESVQPLGRLL